VLLEDWASYLDSVRFTDRVVGEIVERLTKEGILEKTVILFLTDHGISHARGKQFLYEEGIHVPFVIRGPGIAKGRKRDDLIEHIDMAAVSLALAGIPIPKSMQARDVLAKSYRPRDAIFSARDRCDETVEHMRCVRTERFKYIRNFLPARPQLQPNAYKDKKSIYVALRKAHGEGRLNAVQSLLFASTRPAEELYDLKKDPHEIRNLAADAEHRETLESLRKRLERWMEETDDHGRTPETDEMFASDMAVYVGGLKARKRDPAHLDTILRNIALMKKWAKEGK
jgi:arylsulfatase A-like enzyme